MGIKHLVPAGLPTGTVAGKVAGDDWRADHQSIPFAIPIIQSTTNAALTPAAASAAANTELFATSKATRMLVDLSTATQARLVSMVIVLASAGSYKLSYMTSNVAAWAAVGDAGPSLTMSGGTAGALKDSGWVNLAAGARIDNCYLAVLVGTAIGTTAPTVGSLTVFFR